MQTKTHGGCLNAFQLKLIALAFMIFDHTHIAFGAWCPAAGLLSRFVAPLFAYFVVEGFFYTHDRRAYAIRLWGIGLFVAVGNLVVERLTNQPHLLATHTIMLTLACGFTLLWLLEYGRQNNGWQRWACWAAVPVMMYLAIFHAPFEGALQVLPVMLIYYFCRNLNHSKVWISVFVALYSFALFALFFLPLTGEPIDWLYNSDWMQFLVIPFLFLYNGKPGPKTAFSKWMFYIGYPAHIWFFALIHMLLRS